jgi:hypothetical protein
MYLLLYFRHSLWTDIKSLSDCEAAVKVAKTKEFANKIDAELAAIAVKQKEDILRINAQDICGYLKVSNIEELVLENEMKKRVLLRRKEEEEARSANGQGEDEVDDEAYDVKRRRSQEEVGYDSDVGDEDEDAKEEFIRKVARIEAESKLLGLL